MARKLPPVNVWVQSVSRGNRKSCPSCRKKLEPGENIWTYGEYVRGKWRTWGNDFCKYCFEIRYVSHLMGMADRGRGWDFAGRGGVALPAWLSKGEPEGEEATFWAAVDESKEKDLLPLAVLADWLAERRDPREAALRWCVEEKKYPYADLVGDYLWSNRTAGRGSQDPSAVPDLVFDRMIGRRETDHCYVLPITRSKAYRRLAWAWASLAGEGKDPLNKKETTIGTV